MIQKRKLFPSYKWNLNLYCCVQNLFSKSPIQSNNKSLPQSEMFLHSLIFVFFIIFFFIEKCAVQRCFDIYRIRTHISMNYTSGFAKINACLIGPICFNLTMYKCSIRANSCPKPWKKKPTFKPNNTSTGLTFGGGGVFENQEIYTFFMPKGALLYCTYKWRRQFIENNIMMVIRKNIKPILHCTHPSELSQTS